MGRGSSVVGLGASVRKVLGSNSTLAVTYGLWQILHSQFPVALQRVNSVTVSMLWSGALHNGSCWEKCYRNG